MQQLPERKSPRAGRYDYTSAGVYFVTVCTQDHEEYFGKVVDGRMVLNQVGKVCEEEIGKLNDRGTVDIHEWVVMPNHVHLLLCMGTRLPNDMSATYINEPRRDALMARPNVMSSTLNDRSDGWLVWHNTGGQSPNEPRRDASLMRPNDMISKRPNDTSPTRSNGDGVWCGADGNGMGDHSDAPPARPYARRWTVAYPYRWPTLGIIINVFKWNVKKYAQIRNIPFARQSRYHDHIVRDEREYNNIKRYIQNNPEKWAEDRTYVQV